ncbi:MAG: sigma 54-interacting transcriptional regulator [Bacteroidia bacterium]|nr:sigma 54-interacting transcriptional regulator [Bacteroidia bacterium]MDW8347748.1 sigma 54-interacting transcriptional regulator [Bacteroidia bacterium]
MDIDVEALKKRFNIIGNAPMLIHALRTAAQVASTDVSVLILGESGTGKEVFSKIIHQLSHRKNYPFIAVNCGAIPEGTIDSELFGHEKGAFTGAVESRKGYFETANGGTIFLDEIGEMPLMTQARLLRVLENGEFIRVGSSKIQKTNVRIVAATNVMLTQAIEKKQFREDLYYRLNTVPLYIPPLRQRGEDIIELFRYFAYEFALKHNRTTALRLEEDAKPILLKYTWKGNVRELRNIVEQMTILVPDNHVSAEVLSQYLDANSIKNTPVSGLPSLATDNSNSKDFYTEREILYKVLFDLKKDVNDLKKVVSQLLQNRTDIPTANIPNLFLKTKDISTSLTDADTFHDFSIIEQEAQPVQEESLSLEQKEIATIIAALKKHHHNRRKAAQELGISERTLYRKIKQYNLDE